MSLKIIWIFPKNTNLKYTNKDIILEAKKYKKMKDFRENSPKYYAIAYDRNLMPEIRTFLTRERTPVPNEYLFSIAKKYESIKAFRKESNRGLEFYRLEVDISSKKLLSI